MQMFYIILHLSLASIVMKSLTAVSWRRGKTSYLDSSHWVNTSFGLILILKDISL